MTHNYKKLIAFSDYYSDQCFDSMSHDFFKKGKEIL